MLQFVKGCADCQWHKVNTRPTQAPLHPIFLRAEAMPFEIIDINFITKLPLLQATTLSSLSLIITAPKLFIPCRGNHCRKNICTLLIYIQVHKGDMLHTGHPTEHLHSLPPSHWWTIRTEQSMGGDIPFILVNHQQNNCAHYLPIAEFAHNNWKNKTSRESPPSWWLEWHTQCSAPSLDTPSPVNRGKNIKWMKTSAEHPHIPNTHMTS